MFGRKRAGAEHFSHIFVENLRVAKNLSLVPVCNLSIILVHARNCPPGPHLCSCFYLNNPRNSDFFHLCSLQVSKAIRISFDSSTQLTLSNPSWSVVPSPFHRAGDEPVAELHKHPCLVSIPSVLFIRLVSSTCFVCFSPVSAFFPSSSSNEKKLIIKVNTSVSKPCFTFLQKTKFSTMFSIH